MLAEIITIGDEILIGQTIDTNSAWMGKELNAIGVKISRITSVQDSREAILEALNLVSKEVQLILITGGLGPTKDDITKKVLTHYFGGHLVRNEEVLLKIENFFRLRNREMLEVNRQQADLPNNAIILQNDFGTASGMWFEKNNQIFVSMPGVPYEMKHLVKDRVIPKIKELHHLPAIYHKTIMTEGVGESFLVEIIKDWENSLNALSIKVAYLPSPGIVRIRLTAEGENRDELQNRVNKKAEELNSLVPQYIFGEDDVLMEESIGEQLQKEKKTIATAESCTGGYLAHLFTSVSGSSNYFLGSIISYANEVKQNALGVEADDILKHGAVSQTVVEQMAIGVRERMNSDFALATSGVAGPNGGSDEKPVGTVWIAISSKDGVYSKKFLFEKNRERNIRRSALAAISMLRRTLNGDLKL